MNNSNQLDFLCTPKALLNREDTRPKEWYQDRARPLAPVDLVNAQFINGAIKMLEKAGASFKIVDKYGVEYGTLVLQEEVKPKKPRKKRVTRYQRGELIGFYMQYIEKDIHVGGQFYVPVGNYPAEHVRSAVCSTLSTMWGQKSYNTHVDGDLVLVTRLK